MRLRAVVAAERQLDRDGRSLFVQAYGRVLGALRSSYRTLRAADEAERVPRLVRLAKAYRTAVEDEVSDVVADADSLLETVLIPGAGEPESLVQYRKMQGDFWRYACECLRGAALADAKREADEAYAQAAAHAERDLPVHSAIRLGVVLNRAVYAAEIGGDAAAALAACRAAFDAAMAVLEDVPAADFDESAASLAAMKEAMHAWRQAADE